MPQDLVERWKKLALHTTPVSDALIKLGNTHPYAMGRSDISARFDEKNDRVLVYFKGLINFNLMYAIMDLAGCAPQEVDKFGNERFINRERGEDGFIFSIPRDIYVEKLGGKVSKGMHLPEGSYKRLFPDELWNKPGLKTIQPSKEFIDIARKHWSDAPLHVEARFDRRSNLVILKAEGTNLNLDGALMQHAGLSHDKNRNILGEPLIETTGNPHAPFYTMPAQIYVDKFGGEVPGIERKL